MVLEKVGMKLRLSGESVYEKWMKDEGIPIHEAAVGVDDITALPRRPWARMGGLGTFLQLLGTVELQRGLYIAEIPGGGALNPEKHLYDEAIFILQGRGIAEVWQEGGSKVSFEWGKGSLFAPPLNTWHRLVNGSREPAVFLGVTTAPRVMNTLFDSDFVFNCEHVFKEFFGGNGDYFSRGEQRERSERGTTWYTNFIPDAWAELLDPWEYKVAGGGGVGYHMARDFPAGHISEWGVGSYHKAHYHTPGALLIGLRGTGYVPLWHYTLGAHPYMDGHGDQVIEVKWGENSMYVPPEGWFHQHMNAGTEPARHIAFYSNRRLGGDVENSQDRALVTTSVREGGCLLHYEDEDPEIRRRFMEELKKAGVECTMPPVQYRTDPLPPLRPVSL